MAKDNSQRVQCVAQGRCTECGKHKENYSVRQRDFDLEWGIERMLTCECGARAVVTITDDSLLTQGSITHDGASWN